MSYARACRILDAVKDGHPYPLHIINRALQLTGDLEEECF